MVTSVDGVRVFAINPEQCKIVNSMGVSYSIGVVYMVEDLGARVGSYNVARTMAKTFTIMGLLPGSSIRETEEEALRRG